jgi:hypothetical protein
LPLDDEPDATLPPVPAELLLPATVPPVPEPFDDDVGVPDDDACVPVEAPEPDAPVPAVVELPHALMLTPIAPLIRTPATSHDFFMRTSRI